MRWFIATSLMIGIITASLALPLLYRHRDLFIPDTFGDMWERLSEIEVPGDFEQVEARFNGLRSGFMAAGQPYVERSFSAPWETGRLCGRLEAIARSLGDAHPGSSPHVGGDCVFSVRIESGWRAQIVNVWDYDVVVFAHSPDRVALNNQYRDCEEVRARLADSSSHSSYFHRTGECWLRPGEAKVRYTLKGKRGW